MSDCPCGTGKTFDQCCEPFLTGKEKPSTALELMRARYTAHTRVEIGFVTDTQHPAALETFDAEGAERWAKQSTWLGLEIVNTSAGGPDDEVGTVEFVATYRDKNDQLHQHRELSMFEKFEGDWRFRDAQAPGSGEPIRRETPKIGRNEPCPCGSGKKFKKCCAKAA